ncbi:DUF2088 domain-containing protein|uniref:LarA-like N-terminal domain-containing protein n=1 Tax=Dendrosporobacter quercicolus TaxID=146817 RepID=A0A1G9SM61_9FIRM|nr:lactate racemase domain-containing protein [Dendrosporobacter quercicolus]NSL48676.1 DUF2088 domain-containing protein [Dendrosporobacter quercicolus DSM 1736]SDM36407.1 protein of unknown function [Dendrosporobacter quercicolus]
MPILLEEDFEYALPDMYRIRQKFRNDALTLETLETTLRVQLRQDIIRNKLKPGQKIAVAVGSRGIRNLLFIVRTVIDEMKQAGARPFVVSAMGSHGGGTEEGQRRVLADYGITTENLQVPICTSTNVKKIGMTSKGLPVYFDQAALEADLIVPINRIKLHTDFVGELQSGLCKMLVIGLGNQIGCSALHEAPPEDFAGVIEEAAGIILNQTKVGFGLAVIENGYDKTAIVEAIAAENLVKREKELVQVAKDYMPTLMIPEIDILIMQEIGKNVSGAGYDPNIVGRSSVLEQYTLTVPAVRRMILLDVTAESHGNGIGVGLFDIITREVHNKLNLEQMYANAIACKCIEDVKIPLIAATEEEAIRVAVKVTREISPDSIKIVRIKNTLELEYIEVSAALLPEIANNENLRIAEGCEKR